MTQLVRVSSPTPIADIQALVAKQFRLPRRIMRSRERVQPAPLARQVAMYLAVTRLGKRQSIVCRQFDRDPSTVSYAVARVRELIGRDQALAASVRAVEEQL